MSLNRIVVDLYVNPVRAELDEVSGHAALVTSSACYVWNYVKVS